jgi:hypothetical protein
MIDRKQFERDAEQLIADYAGYAYDIFGDLNSKVILDLVGASEEGDLRLARTTPAWGQLLLLYDYAYRGDQPDGYSPTQDDLMDVFCDLGRLRLAPDSVKKVVQLAEARSVLDGGSRQIPVEFPDEHLSIEEVAALADMDTTSVRNAMSPKVAGRLVGTQHASRTFVAVKEARRWLTGRRGFVPTPTPKASSSARATIEVSQKLADQLAALAQSKGVTIERFLARQLKAAKEAS